MKNPNDMGSTFDFKGVKVEIGAELYRMAFISFILFTGEVDLIDAIIHFLMK